MENYKLIKNPKIKFENSFQFSKNFVKNYNIFGFNVPKLVTLLIL